LLKKMARVLTFAQPAGFGDVLVEFGDRFDPREHFGGTTMTCPRCHAENRAGMRYCANCAAPLLLSCQACGTDNPLENKFCGQCGARVGQPAVDGAAILPAPAGELKRVSILFCDLVDSTGLAERLGPEVMHELIRAF